MQKRAAVGKINCFCCGEEIPAKENENGTISVSCPWCDFSGYAKGGTEAARLIAPKIKRPAAPVVTVEEKKKAPKADKKPDERPPVAAAAAPVRPRLPWETA